MSTSHYERRDDGFYIVSGGGFLGDPDGEAKVEDQEELQSLLQLDEKTQHFYLDLRTVKA